MHKLAIVALVVGCGTEPPAGPPDTGPATEHSGVVGTETWTGKNRVTASVTIPAGVTVTVEAGAVVEFAATAGITLQGTLDVEGTSGAPVTLTPQAPGGHFGGVSIASGGQLTMHYGLQDGGGIDTSGTAKATIIDSRLSRSPGDYLVMGGGTVDVEYSAIGVEPGEHDTTHCDMHFSGPANTIKVTHTNVSTSAYGIMFYGGMGADFTYDNWFSNGIDVDATPGVSGDFSFSWFEKGAPSGSGITANNMATARIDDAGPRP